MDTCVNETIGYKTPKMDVHHIADTFEWMFTSHHIAWFGLRYRTNDYLSASTHILSIALVDPLGN